MASLMSDCLQFLHQLSSLVSSCEVVSIYEAILASDNRVELRFDENLTFEVLRRQEDRSNVVIYDEMAQLRSHFCTIPSHEQHLANGPEVPG